MGPFEKNDLPLSTIVLTGKKEGGSTKKIAKPLGTTVLFGNREGGSTWKIDDHLVPQY